MIRLEDKDFEKDMLESESHILVPVEVSLYEDGSIGLLVWSFAEKAAVEFEKLFAAAPFSDDARAFLKDKLRSKLRKLGYYCDGVDVNDYYDYRGTSDGTCIPDDCEIIDSLDNEEWDDSLSLDEFELDRDNPADRMAVIRRDGRIVSFCGVDDIGWEDDMPEITVETAENYRNQGFGSACVRKLASYFGSELKTDVRYTCNTDNEASASTAEAAGLKRYRTVMSIVALKRDE